LPKGKLEFNEDIAECAVREVEEECGIDDVSIESKLLQTYHTYTIEGKMILKETHWYLMKSIIQKVFAHR
jgi:8-oxo-dGTP pyrophosphatase MutT (NUDIX family)